MTNPVSWSSILALCAPASKVSMLTLSLKPQVEATAYPPSFVRFSITTAGYREVFTKYPFFLYTWNSLVVAAGSTLLGLAAIPLYLFGRRLLNHMQPGVGQLRRRRGRRLRDPPQHHPELHGVRCELPRHQRNAELPARWLCHQLQPDVLQLRRPDR